MSYGKKQGRNLSLFLDMLSTVVLQLTMFSTESVIKTLYEAFHQAFGKLK